VVGLPNVSLAFAHMFLDILLVNKNNNLNVYKDNKLLLDTKASILDSQMTTRVPCCGQEEEQNLSAVNTSFDENTRSSDLDDIDFNDWVGMFRTNQRRLG
jgi:hypothetical protein